jgi:hypothetical protein
MRFQLVHRGEIPKSEEWMRYLKGDVNFDAQGNRYYRPDHMSQSSPEKSMLTLLNEVKGDWYITFIVEPDVTELIRLLNKLAPVSISPFISP